MSCVSWKMKKLRSSIQIAKIPQLGTCCVTSVQSGSKHFWVENTTDVLHFGRHRPAQSYYQPQLFNHSLSLCLFWGTTQGACTTFGTNWQQLWSFIIAVYLHFDRSSGSCSICIASGWLGLKAAPPLTPIQHPRVFLKLFVFCSSFAIGDEREPQINRVAAQACVLFFSFLRYCPWCS